jgi:exodeoxyribonuclease VII large subunit
MSTPVRPNKVFRLRDVTRRIKEMFVKASTKRIWLRAHLIVQKDHRQGHFYCQLADVEEDGRTVAQMRAVILKWVYPSIVRKLQEAGQAHGLNSNREIQAHCSVEFHEVYGLSLLIHDVDPYGGEAHIDRNRRLILEKLKSEGILEKNHLTPIPAAALRIGLITSKGSAAYNDFCHTLQLSPYAFKVIFASSLMQGTGAENEIVRAIQNLLAARPDLICIVRGGGSPLDLATLECESIARAIANCPVPVFVGIGHEIDFGLLDHVAHTSYKTPTAVAESLVRRVRELDGTLALAKDRLCELVDRQIHLAEKESRDKRQGLTNGVRKHLDNNTLALRNRYHRVQNALATRFTSRAAQLSTAAIQLRERCKSLLAAEESKCGTAWSRLPVLLNGFLESVIEKHQRDTKGLVHGTGKLLAWKRSELAAQAANLRSKLEQATARKSLSLQERATRLRSSVEYRLREESKQVRTLARRGAASSERFLRRVEINFRSEVSRFHLGRYEKTLNGHERSLEEKNKRLQALRPDNLLLKGYSITRDASGRILRSVKGISTEETVVTEMSDGFLESVVTCAKGKANGAKQ